MVSLSLETGGNPDNNVDVVWSDPPTLEHVPLLANARRAVTSDREQRRPEVSHRIEQQDPSSGANPRHGCLVANCAQALKEGAEAEALAAAPLADDERDKLLCGVEKH